MQGFRRLMSVLSLLIACPGPDASFAACRTCLFHPVCRGMQSLQCFRLLASAGCNEATIRPLTTTQPFAKMGTVTVQTFMGSNQRGGQK